MKQKPLYFFAKTSKSLQLEMIRTCMETFHQLIHKKSLEETFLDLLIETAILTKNSLTYKGKPLTHNLDVLSQKDALMTLSVIKKRTKPDTKRRQLRSRKAEILKLRAEGRSYRELEKLLGIDHSTIQKEVKTWQIKQDL